MSDENVVETPTNQPILTTASSENAGSPAIEARIDQAAVAALAMAVADAEKAAGDEKALFARRDDSIRLPPKKVADAKERGPEPAPDAPPRRRSALPLAASAAAAGLIALGAGFAGGQAWHGDRAAEMKPVADAVKVLRAGQDDVVRLTGDVKALRAAVEGLKTSADRARTEGALKQTQVLELSTGRRRRIPAGPRRSPSSSTASKARPGTPARIRAAASPPSASASTGSSARSPPARPPQQRRAPQLLRPPADGPGQTGSVAKSQTIEGWTLREVYDGVALIEGAKGRIVEAGPGETVPGLGRYRFDRAPRQALGRRHRPRHRRNGALASRPRAAGARCWCA